MRDFKVGDKVKVIDSEQLRTYFTEEVGEEMDDALDVDGVYEIDRITPIDYEETHNFLIELKGVEGQEVDIYFTEKELKFANPPKKVKLKDLNL